LLHCHGQPAYLTIAAGSRRHATRQLASALFRFAARHGQNLTIAAGSRRHATNNGDWNPGIIGLAGGGFAAHYTLLILGVIV
jgi:hypothetical protein